MKANELMIGDWVCYDGDENHECPVRIDAINTEDAGVEGDYYDVWEPIPLTPEILKKNRFKYYEPYDPEIKTEGYKSNDNRIHIRREKTSESDWFCIIYTKGMMEELMLGISYVHELQHALKLCGIEKEIVL